MMNGSRIETALLVLTGIAPSVMTAQTVTAWPQIAVGTATFETTTEFTQHRVVGKSEDRTSVIIHATEHYDVREVMADGTTVIRVRRDRIWGEVTDRQGVHPFDTRTDELPPRAAETWIEAMSGTEEYSLDQKGRLGSVRPVLDDGSLGELDAHGAETMQVGFLQHPDLPLEVGASWSPRVGIHECTPSGCVEFDTANTLEKVTEKTLTVSTKAVPPSNESSEDAEASIARQLVLSRDDGLPLRLDIVGKQSHRGRGTSLTVEATIRIRRVEEGDAPKNSGSAQSRPTSRPQHGKNP